MKPSNPRQLGSIALQGRAQRGAKLTTDKNLLIEKAKQVLLNPWRDTAASRFHLASLALTSAQSSSDHQTEETRDDSNAEHDQIHKVRR